VAIGNGWQVTGTTIENGTFYRILEQGGATLKMAGPHHWQNPALVLDVDLDGFVIPLDAASIINQLNSRIFIDSTGRLADPTTLDPFPLQFYDTDGNEFATSLDVLGIVNFLNGAALPEGESVPRNVPTTETLMTPVPPANGPLPFADHGTVSRSSLDIAGDDSRGDVGSLQDLLTRPPDLVPVPREQAAGAPEATDRAIEELQDDELPQEWWQAGIHDDDGWEL
jgi:hypothetical protein